MCCVHKNSVNSFSEIRCQLETDRSSSIDKFMTDKNDGPMEHDGFGGGESIDAGGRAKR